MRRERLLDAIPHVFGAGIDLKERGSHAYNAWHRTPEIPPKQNTKVVQKNAFWQPRHGTGSWCKSEKKSGEIREGGNALWSVSGDSANAESYA